jgi:hypothetical protein
MNILCETCMVKGGCGLKQFEVTSCARRIDDSLPPELKAQMMKIFEEKWYTEGPMVINGTTVD